MRLDWMSPSAKTWQQLQLISIFNQLLSSSNFNVLVLNYENSTMDTVSTITESLRVNPSLHEVAILNVDQDHERDAFEWRPFFARAVCVEIYDNHKHRKLVMHRWKLDMLNVNPKFIRIYQPHASIANFNNRYRHTTIIKLETIGLQVISFNYNASFTPRMRVGKSGDLFKEFFIDRTVDMEGRKVYMGGGLNVPNQFNARAFVNGKEKTGLSGIYAYVGQVIGEYLNATFVFVLPYRIRIKGGKPYVRYEQLRQRQYQADFVLPFADQKSLAVDLYDEYTDFGLALYPHKQENFVVLVPNERRQSTRLWHMLATSPVFTIWCSAIILFSLVRCMLRRSARNDAIETVPADQIAFETWALSFGWTVSSKAKLQRPERVLVVFISVFAILSGIFCSGMLLQEFTFNAFVTSVKTLHDLQMKQRVTIMIPLALDLNKDIWSANHTLVNTQLNVIYGEILNGNTQCSYVVPESVADVLLAEDYMFDLHGQPIFHKIKERINSKYMAIHTASYSLHPSLHVLMQRLVMHGLMHHFDTKCKIALGVRVEKRTNHSVFGGIAISVSIDQVFFVFILFLMGQALSMMAFLVEWMYYRRKRLYEVWRVGGGAF